jgi:hypothetical protein
VQIVFPSRSKRSARESALLQEISYGHPAPLCDGAAGPCDAELQAIIDRKKREYP